MLADDVLNLVSRIPNGRVTTYKAIAEALGNRSYRAIGRALRGNKHPVVIPCHRVVCSDGRLGGYSGELDSWRKIELLEGEGVMVKDGKVDMNCFFFDGF